MDDRRVHEQMRMLRWMCDYAGNAGQDKEWDR